MILLCIDCSTASLPKTGNGLLIFVTRKGLALVPWGNLPRITCVRVYVLLCFNQNQRTSINEYEYIIIYIYVFFICGYLNIRMKILCTYMCLWY